MGRTGTAENQQNNQQMEAIQQQQNDVLTADQAKFTSDSAKLQNGQDIGANPYTNPDYLRNQNMIAATTADAGNNAEADQLEATTRRTGLNSASLGYTKDDMSRNKVRALTDYMAGLNDTNYNKNLAWQQYLLGNDMGTAGVANNAFGTATQGRDSSLQNLTQIGLASYGPWNALIGAAGAAGAAGIGKIPTQGRSDNQDVTAT